jgi:hypothetical protein
MAKKRNYRLEYDRDHSSPEDIKRRAGRVKARRMLEKEGRVKKGDGREVDHKNHNPRDNSKSNLRVVDKKTNRKKQPPRK